MANTRWSALRDRSFLCLLVAVAPVAGARAQQPSPGELAVRLLSAAVCDTIRLIEPGTGRTAPGRWLVVQLEVTPVRTGIQVAPVMLLGSVMPGTRWARGIRSDSIAVFGTAFLSLSGRGQPGGFVPGIHIKGDPGWVGLTRDGDFAGAGFIGASDSLDLMVKPDGTLSFERAKPVTLGFAFDVTEGRWPALVVGGQMIATEGLDTDASGVPVAPAGDSTFPVFTVGADPPRTSLSYVTTGTRHGCGLTSDGQAYCWGADDEDQRGDGPFTTEAASAVVEGGLTFTMLSSGSRHTCGIAADGQAYCWGANSRGQLGDGGSRLPSSSKPAPVKGGLRFSRLSAGSAHTCGLSEGVAYCWGENRYGQLGDSLPRLSDLPLTVRASVRFTDVVAGGGHSCGLTGDGQAYCWGANSQGQLGDGTGRGSPSPVAVSGNVVFQKLAAGTSHTCGLTQEGAAYCWGSNRFGRLGDGTRTDRASPVPVSGGLTFTRLTAGGAHTCGLSNGGRAFCWGNIVGDGTSATRTVPTPVRGDLLFTSLAARDDDTCGVTPDGHVYCWGTNEHAMPGDRTTPYGRMGERYGFAPVRVDVYR